MLLLLLLWCRPPRRGGGRFSTCFQHHQAMPERRPGYGRASRWCLGHCGASPCCRWYPGVATAGLVFIAGLVRGPFSGGRVSPPRADALSAPQGGRWAAPGSTPAARGPPRRLPEGASVVGSAPAGIFPPLLTSPGRVPAIECALLVCSLVSPRTTHSRTRVPGHMWSPQVALALFPLGHLTLVRPLPRGPVRRPLPRGPCCWPLPRGPVSCHRLGHLASRHRGPWQPRPSPSRPLPRGPFRHDSGRTAPSDRGRPRSGGPPHVAIRCATTAHHLVPPDRRTG